MYQIRNASTGATLHTAPTLTVARDWCGQRLYRAVPDRPTFLWHLAAGLVMVYDVSGTCHADYPAKGPGF